MLNREVLQRLNSLHTQVAPAQTTKVGWVRWLVIYPFISQDEIKSHINSTDGELETEEFHLPALAHGLPSLLSSRVKTTTGWLEPQRQFRVRCFEVEQQMLEERDFDLEGDESFIVDVVNEVTSSLDRVCAILASLSIDADTLDYMDRDFPI